MHQNKSTHEVSNILEDEWPANSQLWLYLTISATPGLGWDEIIGVSWATRKHAKHVTRSVASSKSLLKMPQISKLRLLLYGNWYLFGETRPRGKPHAMVVRLHASTFAILTTASDDHSFPQSQKTISWQLRNPSVTTCSNTCTLDLRATDWYISFWFYLSSNSIIYIQWAQNTLKFCMVFVPRLALPNLTFQRFETLDLCGENRVPWHVSASR